MKVFMTGGTGFVGTCLAARLLAEGHAVTVLTDRPGKAGPDYLAGNPTVPGKWQQAVAEHDTIVNLAGASIFSRWTPERKRIIRSSRIDTTRNLVAALPKDASRITFFSTSAVGYYGFHEDETLDESSPPGDDFLASLARSWEEEALRAREKGARVLLTRFGIVLGENGGALGQMIPLFRYFLGGPLGSGRQWFSWVHIDDLAAAFLFLHGHTGIAGPVNLCSPNPLTNRELAKAIGKALGRPAFLPAPAFAIRLLLGEFGDVLLKGQRVVPSRLLEAGFQFRYPTIDAALRAILGD